MLLGAAFLLSPETLREGFGFASGQEWGDLAFALPLAMLAYTGLETAANLAEEAREPGRTLPRSLFSAIGLVVLVTVLIAAIGLSAYPVTGGETALGEEWLEAPLVGIAAAFDGQLPGILVDALRMAVGISGALILLGAATTSVSGITRLTHSLAEHGSLPREFAPARAARARLERGDLDRGRARDRRDRRHRGGGGRRSRVPRQRLFVRRAPRLHGGAARRHLAADPGAGAPAPVQGPAGGDDPRSSASSCRRHRRSGDVRRSGCSPLRRIRARATQARCGSSRVSSSSCVVRRRTRHGLLEHVAPVEELPPAPEFGRILVPMKLGDIGEEMVATAIALAKESGGEVLAFTVVRVPRKYPLEGELPPDVAEKVERTLEEARALGAGPRRRGRDGRRAGALDRPRDPPGGASPGTRI